MQQQRISKIIAGLVSVLALNVYADDDYQAPRNSFGQPDLGGIWNNTTITPFERPEAFGNQLVLTEEQAAKQEKAAKDYIDAGNAPTDPSEGAPTDDNTRAGYNRFWTTPGESVVRVDGDPRSSMITFPTDGRVPPRKEGAPPYKGRVFLRTEDKDGNPVHPNDNPETRGLSERCVFMQTAAGAVLRPVLYNNNYQISQGRDHVAIWIEMIHDVRIIRLNEEHHNNGVRPWMGDSVGHYEGDTLVVETTNYHPTQDFFGNSDQLTITERFTRVAEDRLHYEFTIKDPKVWEEPWGGEYEFWASNGIYEYACHEGNYGMFGILAGARAEEKRAAEKKK